jgi:hypothetical protein
MIERTCEHRSRAEISLSAEIGALDPSSITLTKLARTSPGHIEISGARGPEPDPIEKMSDLEARSSHREERCVSAGGLPAHDDKERSTQSEDGPTWGEFEAVGRRKIVISRLWTSMCFAYTALRTLQQGYEVRGLIGRRKIPRGRLTSAASPAWFRQGRSPRPSSALSPSGYMTGTTEGG